MAKLFSLTQAQIPIETKLTMFQSGILATLQLLTGIMFFEEDLKPEQLIIDFDSIRKIVMLNDVKQIDPANIPDCLIEFDKKLILMYLLNEQIALIQKIQF